MAPSADWPLPRIAIAHHERQEARCTPWNKGKPIGARPPLRPKHVWAISNRLMVEAARRPRHAQSGDRQQAPCLDGVALKDPGRKLRKSRSYLTASTALGAPSVTFPVSALFWYEKMLPPPSCCRPRTLDITVDSFSTTNAPGPTAEMP